MQQILAKVVSNQPVLPNVNVIWFSAPEIAGEIKPGQFMMVRCGEGYDPYLRRPISVHRMAANGDAKEPGFGLLIGIGGTATSWLASRRAGDEVDVIGPLGHGFTIDASAESLLLIGGGFGVAPLIGLAEAARNLDRKVNLLLGARDANSVYPADLLPEGVEMHVVTAEGNGDGERSGFVTDHIGEFLGQAGQVFACGPRPMYRSLAAEIDRHRFQGSVQVLMEERMACGVGTCGSCLIDTRFGQQTVCLDGPMFELRDLSL